MAKNKYEKQKYGMEKASPRTLTEEELLFINNKVPKKPIERAEEEVTLTDADKVQPVPGGGFEPFKQPEPVVQTPAFVAAPAAPVKQPDNTIVINDANKHVELIFETSVPRPDGTPKKVVFSVSIGNSSVDITDDSISILIRSDVDIKPPTLVPMTIIVDNGEHHEVIYAGGKHKFGKFTNISFVKLDV